MTDHLGIPEPINRTESSYGPHNINFDLVNQLRKYTDIDNYKCQREAEIPFVNADDMMKRFSLEDPEVHRVTLKITKCEHGWQRKQYSTEKTGRDRATVIRFNAHVESWGYPIDYDGEITAIENDFTDAFTSAWKCIGGVIFKAATSPRSEQFKYLVQNAGRDTKHRTYTSTGTVNPFFRREYLNTPSERMEYLHTPTDRYNITSHAFATVESITPIGDVIDVSTT